MDVAPIRWEFRADVRSETEKMSGDSPNMEAISTGLWFLLGTMSIFGFRFPTFIFYQVRRNLQRAREGAKPRIQNSLEDVHKLLANSPRMLRNEPDQFYFGEEKTRRLTRLFAEQ
ncbi:hypothetical protein DAPPUDRAFT_319787 [Daphnia pulex]|uniref:Uncharacterized protein n=1 Tax=Daphnia pulex TaxID=6669 RepID=E9GMU3_DAPPU|nr:hypothetical protein DAPPUDRAFT_319784 [Daphnia pulex]EFX79155.1 hypothetical protein DAPPUDRAFT_319787 [Daphnia pulex]|eukprot:EFX79153.1 hypothetical protein DAPPUDRAFT_319784 [Daphnia pulex]